MGYDYGANTNIDDFYSLDRFEKQLICARQRYDVISSNFYNVNEAGSIIADKKMNVLDIVSEAKKNHNIIAHPVTCYSKNFWTTCTKLRSEEIPRDDFELWRRSYTSGKYKFIILPDYLLNYRVHQQKISAVK